MDKKTSRQSGFALIEILIGVVIISVALMGIAFAWRQSTVTTVSTRNYNQATYYAQLALELLKVNDGQTGIPDSAWNQPTFPQGFTTNRIPANGIIPAAGTMPQFTVSTVLLTTADAPAASVTLKPVRATVTWQETGGSGAVTRSVAIVSYYYLK